MKCCSEILTCKVKQCAAGAKTCAGFFYYLQLLAVIINIGGSVSFYLLKVCFVFADFVCNVLHHKFCFFYVLFMYLNVIRCGKVSISYTTLSVPCRISQSSPSASQTNLWICFSPTSIWQRAHRWWLEGGGITSGRSISPDAASLALVAVFSAQGLRGHQPG